MEQADLLQTIAEVSVAFAGFAGIAAIFGRRYIRDDPLVQQERLLGMIQSSLTCVFFSLFPFMLYQIGLSATSSWRIGSGLMALVWCTLALAMVVRSLRKGIGLGPNPGLAIATLAFGAVFVWLLGLNAFGRFGDHAGAIYLLGLFAILALCGLFFVELFRSFDLSKLE